jgi:hypothetical protein
MNKTRYERLVAHINRKQWWHVPPVDPDAYKKRGKFFASSFAEAEFYGRPLDEPERVSMSKPVVGDEKTIAKALGVPPQNQGMTLEQIATHDARWKKAALKKGFDSIVLMAPKHFGIWKKTGKIPCSIELNILEVNESQGGRNDSARTIRTHAEESRPEQGRNSAATAR